MFAKGFVRGLYHCLVSTEIVSAKDFWTLRPFEVLWLIEGKRDLMDRPEVREREDAKPSWAEVYEGLQQAKAEEAAERAAQAHGN